MTNRIFKTGILLATCSALALPGSVATRAAAPSTSPAALATVKRDIAKIYEEQDAAMEAKDNDRYFATMTPDYIEYDYQGIRHTLQYERSIADKLKPLMQNVHIKSHIDSVAFKDGGAVANTHTHVDFDLTRPSDGRTFHFIAEETDRDFWVTVKGAWKEKISRTLTFHANTPEAPGQDANPAST